MRTAFASVFLVALFVASSVGQQVAIPLLGAEVISFSSPPLAYISNLRYDPAPASNGDANSGPRILFIADKSSPNLYSATFLPNVTGPFPLLPSLQAYFSIFLNFNDLVYINYKQAC